jgi:DNA-binding FadR family transcriptional regulator
MNKRFRLRGWSAWKLNQSKIGNNGNNFRTNQGLHETGHLKQGNKLPTEMELAERFEVTGLRKEALSALSLTGILEIRQGEGIYVKTLLLQCSDEPLSFILLLEKDQLQSILEVRKALEIEAADLAAQRRENEDLETMGSWSRKWKRLARGH